MLSTPRCRGSAQSIAVGVLFCHQGCLHPRWEKPSLLQTAFSGPSFVGHTLLRSVCRRGPQPWQKGLCLLPQEVGGWLRDGQAVIFRASLPAPHSSPPTSTTGCY